MQLQRHRQQSLCGMPSREHTCASLNQQGRDQMAAAWHAGASMGTSDLNTDLKTREGMQIMHAGQQPTCGSSSSARYRSSQSAGLSGGHDRASCCASCRACSSRYRGDGTPAATQSGGRALLAVCCSTKCSAHPQLTVGSYARAEHRRQRKCSCSVQLQYNYRV